MDPIPSSAGIVGTAGRMPLLAWTFDLNGDGVLDIQQPEQLAKLLVTVLKEVAPFLPGGAAAPVTLAVQLLPRIAEALPPIIGGAK